MKFFPYKGPTKLHYAKMLMIDLVSFDEWTKNKGKYEESKEVVIVVQEDNVHSIEESPVESL